MKFAKNKTVAIAIAIFLTLSMAASMMLMPSASAHSNPIWQIPTYAYTTALPNPVGVGQTTLIYLWLNQVYGAGTVGDISGLIAYANFNNNYRFQNYHLTITAPDGTITTKTFDVIQDTTSAVSYSYTPDQVGNYTIFFSYPGQVYGANGNGNPASLLVNDTYLPSNATATFTVQSAPIYSYPASYPLPTEYWTRPIYGENPYWWSISSNWLGTGSPVSSAVGTGTLTGFTSGSYINRYPGDAVGPQTAHVMWTKPLQSSGGVVGGNNFAVQGDTYFEGSAYTNRYQNPIVMNGRIFFTEPSSYYGTNGPTDCVDLRTGQLIWSRLDVPSLSFGYIYNHQDPDQHGAFPAILCTASFARLFDADTGNQLFNVTGVPSGTVAQGPSGEQLRYVFTNLGTSTTPNWVLAEWNSSKLWNYGVNPYSGGSLLYPSIINATALPYSSSLQALISTVPIPYSGTTGTLSNYSYVPGSVTTITVPYGSNLVVNGGVFNSSDPQNRYDWNVSLPWLNVMGNQTVVTLTNGTAYQGYTATGLPTTGNPDASNPVTVVAAFYNNMMICRNGTLPAAPQSAVSTGVTPYTYFAVNLNASKGAIGTVLWWNTLTPPAGNLTVEQGLADPTVGVFVQSYKETMQWVGYSMATGAKIWGPTASQTALDYYGAPYYPFLAGQLAYGKLYSAEYGGIVYCYDLTNGNLLWTYGNGGSGNSTNSGFEVPGNYPIFINAVGNGVIYLCVTEHTPETPIYKGATTFAINATDGTEIWSLSDYTGEFSSMSFAIADGYATFFNGYDNQIYSVGRGPSATTVTAPDLGASFGTPVVIKGTVADISAGTTQNQQAADFPNGVPCASDASMKDWMGYVYQQKPLPTNFTGVPVTIDVLDSNGNYRNIGTATTDATGSYSLTWTPDIPGNYTVIATFHSTNGYWGSYSETSFAVAQAPAATATPTPAPASMTDMYVLGSAVAIIIAIAVVGVIVVLMLRKRP